jgi:hypothetical protein
MSDKHLDNDYEKIRRSLYDLTDQGDEAIELMMELARESEHPRAFEVLGQLIKQNAEIGEKILKLHKTRKEVDKFHALANTSSDNTVTNNNVFIGSTTELQKLLQNEKVIIDGEKTK